MLTAKQKSVRLPLALTMGDPAGIGPEIALMAFLQRKQDDHPFFLLADPDHIARLAQHLNYAINFAICAPSEATSAFATHLPIVPLNHHIDSKFGEPSRQDALATIEAIERGVDYVFTGQASALVTNPISKEALYKVGFTHPGHTEYLGELAERHWGNKVTPVMMIWSEPLAVVPVTIHMSLANVLTHLTRELIVETARITAQDLKSHFGLAQPRLAISGLNPHAGENGSMGREELNFIKAAVDDLQAMGIAARGPLPADTMFHPAARATYDVAICMYHDQALIPVKTLAFDTGVNTTLGLPFIRTSPDHGTAYDIAGKGSAKPQSLIAALTLAARLANTQGQK